jgi:hypothetical protein
LFGRRKDQPVSNQQEATKNMFEKGYQNGSYCSMFAGRILFKIIS